MSEPVTSLQEFSDLVVEKLGPDLIKPKVVDHPYQCDCCKEFKFTRPEWGYVYSVSVRNGGVHFLGTKPNQAGQGFQTFMGPEHDNIYRLGRIKELIEEYEQKAAK